MRTGRFTAERQQRERRADVPDERTHFEYDKEELERLGRKKPVGALSTSL
jgi:hypothetical protein